MHDKTKNWRTAPGVNVSLMLNGLLSQQGVEVYQC